MRIVHMASGYDRLVTAGLFYHLSDDWAFPAADERAIRNADAAWLARGRIDCWFPTQ